MYSKVKCTKPIPKPFENRTNRHILLFYSADCVFSVVWGVVVRPLFAINSALSFSDPDKLIVTSFVSHQPISVTCSLRRWIQTISYCLVL